MDAGRSNGGEREARGRTEALAGASPGSPAAFAGLYVRVAPALHAWARLRVRPGLREVVDPEDLVQEVCCRAFEHFERYDVERGRFRPWLFGIAQRCLQEALVEAARARRAGGREGVRESQVLREVPEEVTSVTRAVARDEAHEELERWLESLEEEERRLVVHRGLEGRSHAEVAELVQLPVEAVKKRWQRLLARVRERGAPSAWLVGEEG